MTTSQVREILKAFDALVEGDGYEVAVLTNVMGPFTGAVRVENNGLLRVESRLDSPSFIDIDKITAISLKK